MKRLFKKTAAKRMLFFIAADMVSITLSIWLAFLIRFDGHIPPQYLVFVPRIILLAMLFCIPVFYFQKLYSFSWSYVSANEVISIFLATTMSFAFLSITIFASDYFPHFLNFPRSTIFTSYLLVLAGCAAARFSKRIYFQMVGFGGLAGKDRTLIVGAGDTGEQILRNILSSKNNTYFPIGFIDDNPMKKGVAIHGCRVLGTMAQMPYIIEEHQIKQVIIALPSAGSKTIRNAIELARAAGLRKIKIAPQLNEIIRGQISLKNLKDVEVEDLLGRSEITLDKKQIESFIKNKTVLITGAAGSIGSELSRQVARFKPALLLCLDQDETGIFSIAKELKNKFPELKLVSLVGDITDVANVEAVFKEYGPQIVFHAAAYKHVPLMELQPKEAVKNNVLGTQVLAGAAAINRVEKFVFISTDKAVNPTSVMGATKRMCEMICQAYNQKNVTKFVSVRFGNVLDSRGSVIPIFREQIKRGGPVEVTHPDMKRYFMLTSEACLLVMQAGAMGAGGEVFVLDMGSPVKILDLAREMIRLSGFEPDKDIAIVFIGLRPGEKLFEEILTAEEGTAATHNNKIFTAKMAASDFSEVENAITALKAAVYSNEKGAVVEVLKNIIPYYRPQA